MLDSMYIELGRTFHQLAESVESDSSAGNLPLTSGKRISWDDLANECRIVILSEAGSGKTEEIRNTARRLRSDGKAAFFIRLEHVVRDYESAFEEGTYEEFQHWMGSDAQGWLLLDSVDEARLRDPSDFEAAVRKLGRLLTSAKQRIHIVITGRTSAWRPKTDLALCVTHLDFARSTMSASLEEDASESEQEIRIEKTTNEDKVPTFKIVALDDLTSGQVEIFANAKGVTNPKAFLASVERADAWSFTSRPQDLEDLVEFWNDHNRIGSRLELMRNSIDRRLSERDQGRADARPLSNERLRLGARRIAGASTMAHEATIQIPDGSQNMKGLAVKSVLIDWNDVECATLLARPIFDEAIYGTVRFHHRSVREYLTAEWFADLLKQEVSRRRIEELFFRQQYGLEVVVPGMRPILPWLAIFDQKIRVRICQVAPEVLFEGGDPSQLPLDTRRQILHQVCNQLANGVSKRSMTDYAAVQRFANIDLAADIKELIRRFASKDDVLLFLLRMIWQGELLAALPEAISAAKSLVSTRYSRTAAFRAVMALGSSKDKAELRHSFLNESEFLSRDLLAELLKATDSSTEVLDWLFECLRKVEDKKEYSVDDLAEQLSGLVEQTEDALLPSFIDRANALLEELPVVERRHCEVSERYSWLMKAAAIAVERLVKARSAAAFNPASLAVLHKVPVLQQYQDLEIGSTKTELIELVPRWSELNLALFWYLVEHERKWLDRKKSERLTNWWSVSMWGSYVQFDANNFELVLNEVTARPFIDDRLIALSLAFRLYIDGGRRPEQRELLKKVARDDGELYKRLVLLWHPPRQSEEEKKNKRMEAGWKRKSERRRQSEEKNRDDWRRYVTENVEKLRAPGLKKPNDISSAQYYLHGRMRDRDSNSSDRTDGNWQSLEAEFGKDVARAFRDGAVGYWRRNRPKLISEGAPENSTSFSTIFGLTGLAIEARETENWPSTLNEEEAELAFRYAMHELNGFPSWLPRLFAKFPRTTCRMSLVEIAYELSIDKEEKESQYLLYDVSWSGDWLWDAIAPSLYEAVSLSEPTILRNLGYVLNIIQASTVSDERIEQLASRKSKSVEGLDQAAYWFSAWIGVDPSNAIQALEARLDSIANNEERTRFAMIVITQLLGDRRSGRSKVREAYKTPQHLTTLYLLMHRHIRQSEDIDRAGSGAYSPELRDNAQDARERLFAILNDIPGKDAFLALEEIARAHPDEQARPWFKRYAKSKAELDSNNSPWTLSQVREFHEVQERTPSNHRDLFDLAVMRLLDLKDDLEGGDSSNASILRTIGKENEIRKFIGNWCRQSAHGRYSIPQEEELADAKRPDFRWHGVGFDAPVPMELKLADNWTGPKLFERLETQLCGDYLRDIRSRRGIFLLVYRGTQGRWERPGRGKSVDFEGLVQALQAHWFRISGGYEGVDDIRVIGIDLTARSRPPVHSV